MKDFLLQSADTLNTVIVIVAVILVYVLARLVSDAIRRKKSLFRRRKNSYTDCIDKKKNPDGTVYRRRQNRVKKRRR